MCPEDNSIGRHKPTSGVFLIPGEPTIVLVTVCSEKRSRWIAQAVVHDLLTEAWSEADAWLVGHYQIMPDHIHFFVAPRKLEIPLNRWMSY
ncbi:MAG TPA: hypothetical protein VH413_17145 [Verrucomicrobiae bacterium]|jgi:REP element-mobilizing transposase RayT|nr:hypothetical protein [Verrucomicrobiae bacterium]